MIKRDVAKQVGGGRLLVVDPDGLMRWSVKAFLGDVLDVISAESTTGALELLNDQGVDAVVVSEDLPNSGADIVEKRARARNPGVVVVRTVSEPVAQDAELKSTVRLEKPFKLTRLAELLGVSCR